MAFDLVVPFLFLSCFFHAGFKRSGICSLPSTLLPLLSTGFGFVWNWLSAQKVELPAFDAALRALPEP